jgi:hypothetical protein
MSLLERDWAFAWLAAEDEPFDAVAHRRDDLGIASVQFDEAEEADAHPVTIRTHARSSAEYGGKRWAMLSFVAPGGALVPVCRMKVRKRPLGQNDGEATITFDSLPSDWRERRDANLLPRRVLPNFDPVLVSPDRREDPVEILDGMPIVGHYDRVTGEYTTPHLLGVGCPTRTFDDVLGWEEGGVTVEQSGTPLAGVRILLSAEFLQRFDGELDATGVIRSLFPDGVVSTLTGEDFERNWFKAGSAVNGNSGWTFTRAKLKGVPVPAGLPKKVGPVRGSRQAFNYVDDPNLLNPATMSLDVSYYDVEVTVAYSAAQKRVEQVEILLLNGGQDASEGEIKEISLKCEDVTADTVTPQWSPGFFPEGAIRRVGSRNWYCTRAHLSKSNFAADRYDIVGGIVVANWVPLDNDASPIGGSDRATYFHTGRGLLTIQCAILKGVKLLILSSRCVSISFSVPFEDVLDMSCRWAAELILPEDVIPGGYAIGKVTNFAVSDPSIEEYAKATITITCLPGSGEATAPGTGGGVSWTVEGWDLVAIGDYSDQQPTQFPGIGGQAYVVNPVADQLLYVQANDYLPSAGRNDRETTNPLRLLNQVQTSIQFSLTQLSGRDDMVHRIVLPVSPWNGPAQIALPE